MDVVELTKELIDIPSESARDGEVGVAKYVTDYLKGIGLEPELITFNSNNANVIVSIGSGEGLMFNGHMDTVPLGDPSLWTNGISAAVIDDKVYGRGASDMKGGIACMLAALANLGIAKKQLKRRLLFTFVANEETDFRGSDYLLDNRKELFEGVKYGIIGEASFINSKINLQTAQKGAISLEVTFRGKAAHGSRPWLGDNAIVKAARFITEYQKLADSFEVTDELLGKGTANISIVNGGNAINVVPDSCKVSIDRRIVPGETPELAIAQVKEVIKRLGIEADVEMPVSRNAFRLADDSPIITIMKRIIGEDFNTIGATGYTEAELYKAKAGIDSVVFGPGEKEIIHQADEYVTIGNLRKTQEVYEKVITEWCL
ncbi:acetylornithine deacetylase or succinyl-diaminopimelate desuccinylase [mine drainage metagenome]|uniref:Probable succinyl-diaminopimelate desuccinylase n=1 Tax=mine drainage metagenome TaxID=410659 RepID=T1C3L2_9ZZZZ